MNDATPHDLPQPIDPRSLVAAEAVRGAIGGFCWSLLPAGMLALYFWTKPNTGGPMGALLMAGALSLLWAGIAANARTGWTRERMLTDEQRTVLDRRTHRSTLQGLCFALPVGAFVLITTWGYGEAGAILSSVTVVGIWVGSAALVGHGLGWRAVRAMQREARATADRLGAGMIPREAVPAAPSENLQPDVTRVAERRKRIDVGHED